MGELIFTGWVSECTRRVSYHKRGPKYNRHECVYTCTNTLDIGCVFIARCDIHFYVSTRINNRNIVPFSDLTHVHLHAQPLVNFLPCFFFPTVAVFASVNICGQYMFSFVSFFPLDTTYTNMCIYGQTCTYLFLFLILFVCLFF